mmetsp:Transcript_4400/g.10127  ORF Transcript_4400/g.10127 Transcript_4400/m.10127 type:complete len:206 (+) Transcript_4400:1195-1812(+)
MTTTFSRGLDTSTPKTLPSTSRLVRCLSVAVDRTSMTRGQKRRKRTNKEPKGLLCRLCVPRMRWRWMKARGRVMWGLHLPQQHKKPSPTTGGRSKRGRTRRPSGRARRVVRMRIRTWSATRPTTSAHRTRSTMTATTRRARRRKRTPRAPPRTRAARTNRRRARRRARRAKRTARRSGSRLNRCSKTKTGAASTRLETSLTTDGR